MGTLGLIWVGTGILLIFGSGSAGGFVLGFLMVVGYVVNIKEDPIDPAQVRAEADLTKYKIIQKRTQQANNMLSMGYVDQASEYMRDASLVNGTVEWIEITTESK